MYTYKTDFLFSRPSAVAGVARLVDFGGIYDSYNISETGPEADSKAIYMDWAVVGQVISAAAVGFAAPETE